MSSQADQLSLVLIRRLTDGTNEWIDLDVPQRVPAAPGAAYALIDRTNYEAPQTLVVARQGEDLIVEVSDTQVLVLGPPCSKAPAALLITVILSVSTLERLWRDGKSNRGTVWRQHRTWRYVATACTLTPRGNIAVAPVHSTPESADDTQAVASPQALGRTQRPLLYARPQCVCKTKL